MDDLTGRSAPTASLRIARLAFTRSVAITPPPNDRVFLSSGHKHSCPFNPPALSPPPLLHNLQQISKRIISSTGSAQRLHIQFPFLFNFPLYSTTITHNIHPGHPCPLPTLSPSCNPSPPSYASFQSRLVQLLPTTPYMNLHSHSPYCPSFSFSHPFLNSPLLTHFPSSYQLTSHLIVHPPCYPPISRRNHALLYLEFTYNSPISLPTRRKGQKRLITLPC